MNAASPDGVAIEFRDVQFRAPAGQTILETLSLQIQSGETLVLLGRSGSGKTTALRLVNRLLENHANRSGAALITSHGAYAYTSGTPRRVALRPGLGTSRSDGVSNGADS